MKTSWIGVFITTCWLLLGLSLGQVQAADYEEVIYYHNDALGSPIAATDANGDVLWREEYTPYGSRLTYESRETTCTSGTCYPVDSLWDEKQWYTGKYEETTLGINYFGARWYEPEIGRFLSQDPAGFSEDNIFSFNRYAYANNNPYRYIDPDGRNAVTALGGLLTETYNFSTGRGFNGAQVWGALKDGYNGDGAGFWAAAGEDVLAFGGGVLGVSGKLLKLSKTAKVTTGEGAVIGRVKDLQNLKQGEKSLLDRLPDKGNPKANWKQNSGVLRQEMGKGQPIRDASPGDTAGQFLNAERNLLKDRGWTFEPKSNYWNPPVQ